jgi:hypothetical protein
MSDKKKFQHIRAPEIRLTVKSSQTLSDQLEEAARQFDMGKSSIVRRGISEFISLYCPKLFDPNASVIEPSQIHWHRRSSSLMVVGIQSFPHWPLLASSAIGRSASSAAKPHLDAALLRGRAIASALRDHGADEPAQRSSP